MNRIYGVLLLVVVGSFLFTTLLFLNLVQMASLLLLPVSAHAVRRINRFCAHYWWSLCAWCVEHVRGIRIHITGDDVPALEYALVMANHQSMADIPALFTLAVRKKRIGDMKWFVKDVLKYVPGVGWGMLFLDCVFVKRDWHRDKHRIRAAFKKFYDNDIPLWLVTFPEGTRYTEDKCVAARAFAKANKLPELQHVLVPRVKGAVASLEGLAQHIHAVYDVTIGYTPAQPPTLVDLFLGKCKAIHLHVRRFPIEHVPRENERRADWLMSIYQDKDRLLHGFFERGRF